MHQPTGDYKGQGTPREGEWNKEHRLDQVLPSSHLQLNANKNKCFNICKRVCGATCVIPSPPRCVKPPCQAEKKEEKKPWVAPAITDEMKTKVHEAEPKEKVKTIMGLLRGQH